MKPTEKSEWFKKEISSQPVISKDGEKYKIIHIWSRKSPKYIEVLVLLKNIGADTYIINYSGDTISLSLNDIISNLRDISINVRDRTISFTQNGSLSVDIESGKQIGREFNNLKSALRKANSYMESA